MTQTNAHPTVVLFHANCSDGFGAAYSVWKALGDEPTYIPVGHGSPIPSIQDGSRVYLLDFASYGKEVFVDLSKRCQVIVLDHHKTALEKLKELPQAPIHFSIIEDGFSKEFKPGIWVYFDLKRSGAMIAWNFFHPKVAAPELINYVQDRDLWAQALPLSAEVSSAIQSYPFDFKIWDELSKNMNRVKDEGVILNRYFNLLVDTICNQAFEEEIDGYKVMSVNTATHYSEVGNRLLDLYPNSPFAATFYYNALKTKCYSLRSRGDFDVSEIAKRFGGGGHPTAAGYQLAQKQ